MMERKLKIAMFGHKWIPSREGGIEIVVEELSARLVEKGNQVTCYNRKSSRSGNVPYHLKRHDEYKGIKINTVPTIEKKGLSAITAAFFAALYSSFGTFDIVHIHAEGPAFFCWIPKLFGKKVVCTIHGLDWKRAKWNFGLGSKIILQGEKNAARYADEIIVLNKENQKYFKETYNRDTILIPNGVSRPQRKEAAAIRQKWGLEEETYILFLGRLVPEKGLRYLIEAFMQVKTDKKLVIAGGSSDTDVFVQEMRELAKENLQIIFTGFVQGEVIDELYSNAYAYILPSELEGMPLSLLEAMSYGNCCLVSDIPECAEVVEDYALLFKQKNVSDLKEQLQYICENEKIVQEYKNRSADFICNKYNWNDVARKTMELYTTLQDT